MPFPTGTLARPLHIVKTEPHVVIDGSMSWQNPFEHVFVKLLSENRRSIEAVCAWIAQDVKLPSPAPRFVHVPRIRLPANCPWHVGAQSMVAFATVAVEGSVQLIKLDGDVLLQKLVRWDFLEMAAVFDHLIANDDRSEGNMLMDARGGLWLIDHGRSLGGGGQRIFSTEVFPVVRNFLLEKIARQSMTERMNRRSTLMSACIEIAARVPRIPYDSLLVPPEIAKQINHFLTERANRLQAMILDAIGLPDMYQGTVPSFEPRAPQ